MLIAIQFLQTIFTLKQSKCCARGTQADANLVIEQFDNWVNEPIAIEGTSSSSGNSVFQLPNYPFTRSVRLFRASITAS
jgi:hypothetical protein